MEELKKKVMEDVEARLVASKAETEKLKLELAEIKKRGTGN